MSRRRALDDLCRTLAGDPPPDADWMAVMALANCALITPAVADVAGRLPADVRGFVQEVARRNRVRNRRLFAALAEAVGALNGAGVEPVLLKGAALWVAAGRPARFDRILNDLDLLVAPAEVPRALAALTDAGFPVLNRYDGPAVHVVAELARPSDVGAIDLHQRPPGPPGLAEVAAVDGLCPVVEWEGLRARLPTAAQQVFWLVLHDQFHDGDYWRGGFTLRHLRDIAALAPAVDWSQLFGFARTDLCRRAIEVELRAAARFAGAQVPAAALGGGWARIQHERQLLQFAWPGLSTAIAACAVVSEWRALSAHRRADRVDQTRMFGTPAGMSLSARIERLSHIFGGFAAGKV